MAGEWVAWTLDEKSGLIKTDVPGCWVSADHKVLDLPKNEQRVVLKQFAQMTGAEFISDFLEAKVN